MNFLERLMSGGQDRTRRLNEGIGNTLNYYLGPTGIPERLNALAMLNPVQDIYEAGANARDGDYTGAAINTASALMPVVGAKLAGGGLADDAANIISDTLTNVGTKARGAMDAGQAFAADEFGGVGPSKGIRAYHGSPHDFDRFSMDAIGTGEGAQAYGHGLYFAENEGVARGYRDALARNMDSFDDPPKFKALGDKQPTYIGPSDAQAIVNQGEPAIRRRLDRVAKEVAELRKQATEEPDLAPILDGMIVSYDGEVDELNTLLAKGWDNNRPPDGRMYEVNINANPDDFLDWDAPDAGQLKRAGVPLDRKSGRSVMDYFSDDYLLGNNPQQKRLVGNVAEKRADEYAAQRLREAGIPGIKYKDAGSRGLDGVEGTRNYVVFDENLIEIVRKYGIAGAATILGVSASDVQAAMEQGNQ